MIRLAALGLIHEANTFADHCVDMSVLEASDVLRGPDIIAEHAGSTTTMAGYLAAGQQPGVEVVPLVMITLTPAGPLTAEALEFCTRELKTALTEQGPFDGVLAALHGAAVAENVPDVDGYLLRCFRDVVGHDVPVGVSLDLHANISADMCTFSNVLNTYRTNPHVDAKETAEEVADLIVRAVRREIRPTQAYEAVPAVINILCQNTATSPMRDIMRDVADVMAEPGVLSASVSEGYPYADVAEMGMSVVVVTDADFDAAAMHARALAEKVWGRREKFDTTAPSAIEALHQAEQTPRGPVLLLDVGDNIGGGAPGDSVVLLAAARDHGFDSLVTVVADSACVSVCDHAGVEAHVDLSIGAESHPEIGPPVRASATVLALHDGAYGATEALHAGVRSFDGGRSAAVRLDTGQTVILTSRAVMPLSPTQLTMFGLEPAHFQAIVAKGVHSPLAGYRRHVAHVIVVDSPGVTSSDLTRFTYVKRRRPLYPFEPDATFPVVVPPADTSPGGRYDG